MQHMIKVTQVLRVEKSTLISVEADSAPAAIAMLACGEIDIPFADDDVGNSWRMERCSLEHEEYWPVGSGLACRALPLVARPLAWTIFSPVSRVPAGARASMNHISIDRDATGRALARMVDLALGDTGQARRVARFLMSWWNGPELGDFPVADPFGLDLDIAADITTVIGFLGQHQGAIYISMPSAIALRWAKSSRVLGKYGTA